MGYLDLKQDGPMVIEAPPGMQGILDDFFQRPICLAGKIDGRQWCGDVGLPGPDKGKGAKYLIVPPDYAGKIPRGYLAYRSRTYNVFVFWRGFFKDPRQLQAEASQTLSSGETCSPSADNDDFLWRSCRQGDGTIGWNFFM
jgi:hypothetical protein